MKCKVCGCTDDHACPRGCYWVVPGLCSTCVDKIILLVFAGDFYQFINFCREADVDPRNRRVRYISDMTRVIGNHGKKVAFITYGTWRRNTWIFEAVDYLRQSGCIEL